MEQIKHIYHLRWGQETSFRDLKHTIGTANFHSKSPQYIGFELLCRMTMYNFCTIITMEVPIKKETGKWEYQVNLSMAIKICFAFLSDHMGPGNINDLISPLYTAVQARENLCTPAKVPSTSQLRLPFRLKRNCR